MREDEADVSFTDFDDPRRPYTAPASDEEMSESPNYAESMARREGFDDSLRSQVESTTALPWLAR
jgi:hypothetical protein